MVSTRSVKHKFSEGERVLCYEPDPAKTKVLYDSKVRKVLGVGTKKDDKGKNVVHFLIHFQGWNSTWDRFVTEDYILKDTEENRRLQRELADKAQLTASQGNLYRKGRKKRTLSRTSSDNERERREVESESEGEAGVGDKVVNFSPGLRAILDLDNTLVTTNNKIFKLPAYPNVVEILEMYMREFTVNQIKLMCHKRGHLRPTAGKNAHITVAEIYTRACICREIADGLRVYIDFMTERVLLYAHEREQFKEVTTVPFKSRRKEYEGKEVEMKEDHSPVRDTDRRKSLRSHSESNSTPSVGSVVNSSASASTVATGTKKESVVTSETSIASVDLASLLGQDTVKGGENLLLRPMSIRERELLKKLVERKVVHDWFKRQQASESKPIPACLVYGAVHLARALVKIPEIYSYAEHNEEKMKVITEYLNGFTKFLEEHTEWFGESQYCENTYPLPPVDVVNVDLK